MGRIAILSDVHGNAEAFKAVLEDIKQRGINTIINIGDLIGYGPEPEQCIDLAMEFCDVSLFGNHEYAVLNGAQGFNPVAEAAVNFVRKRLKPPDTTNEDMLRRWSFLESLLPSLHAHAGFSAMHGSPRHFIMEYVLPSDPEGDPLKIDSIFDAMLRPIAFVGHTHFPGVIEESGTRFLTMESLEGRYKLSPKRNAIINVGSVGQPRDRDIRACYAEFDGEGVYFRRVEYDVDTTVRKIYELDGLHESLGHRLLEGC
ncbi:MAG: metallophosphoesterase family protein [Planctomycetes bacterium]|nr:metallophosphoesterase family protein [Planctomycetota bacterium]